jgi:hypothetical protein
MAAMVMAYSLGCGGGWHAPAGCLAGIIRHFRRRDSSAAQLPGHWFK